MGGGWDGVGDGGGEDARAESSRTDDQVKVLHAFRQIRVFKSYFCF